MGNKVDLSEVIELSNDLKSASEEIKDSLTSVEDSIDSLISLNSFSGETATAAKNYYQDLHQTVLTSFKGLFTDLHENLELHIKTFHSKVDESETALIKSDYLKNKEEDMNDDYKKLDAAQQTVRDIINSVEDISSATAPSTASIDTAKNDAVDTLIELEENLNSFTSEGEDQISDIDTLLSNIEMTINDAGAVSGSGRFMDYTGTSMTLGLPILKAYNEEKQREAEVEKAREVKDEAINDMDEDSQEVLNKVYNDLKNGEIDKAEFYETLSVLQKAEKDYELGVIDEAVYDSIKGILINSGFTSSFTQNSIQQVVSDKMSEGIATKVHQWLQHNTFKFVNRGLVAAPVYGNVQTFTEPPSSLTNAIRTGARHGTSIVGTAIDFGIQLYSGENVTDAAVKAASHTAIGLTGAEIGGAIGSVIPVGGTIIGGAIGFGLAVGGSMAFDWFYNNKDRIAKNIQDIGESVVDTVKDAGEKIGEAVSGFFGNLGSVFG
ncbi:LXG domain-containing protein [Oceanobacillus caeni]|uniref:T7SS effector LXG polymorphic toxin n=1 Tax=Oceanobacillus TaxID=182709 RepID=UPI00195DBED1|nr:T7SS effector LXG polymorphic toxin [Oceanobacillus caeni]MBU8790683.1 LXG domain-containing protein [Oceanobacillus caeni]MCR1836247.1 LXG domain-containing protein [Oceanobacillus caeni]